MMDGLVGFVVLLVAGAVAGHVVRIARRAPDPPSALPTRDPWAFRDDDRDREKPAR